MEPQGSTALVGYSPEDLTSKTTSSCLLLLLRKKK